MLYFAYFKQHFVMLRLFKNYPQNAGNGISKTPDFKIFRGSIPQDPPRRGLRLRRSRSLSSHNSMTSHLKSASPLHVVPSELQVANFKQSFRNSF